MSGRDDESCDIMRHHATSCDQERKWVGSGWHKMSFDRRRCGREMRWREREQKAGGSRKRKRKTGGRRKRKGFPLQRRRDILPLFPSFFDRFREIRQLNCDAFYEAGNIDPFYDLET